MKIKTITLLILCVILLVPSVSYAQKMGIAAVVNDDVITYSDVEGRVQLGFRASNIKDTPATRAKFETQALETLIEEQLRLQEAERLNITVTDEDIDSAINNIAQQNRVDPTQFREILAKSYGTLPSLKSQVKAQIAWTQVVRSRLRPQINVTEADIDGFISDLNKHEGKEEYNIAEILLLVNNDAESKEKKALADDLVKQLSNGASFPGIARQFSQGKEARNGGAIGWVLDGALDTQINNTVKTMEDGTIAGPIKTDTGYHIILLRSKRTVSTKAIQTSNIHIKQVLIPLSVTASDADIASAASLATTMKNETKDCAAMDALIAAQNNPMSKDIGMVNEAQMPPVIGAAIEGLEDGTMAPPIQAAEGFLLIMPCGREKSGTEEEVRDQIANKIGAERLERLQQRYVRDLRATAYIDVKN